MNVSKRMFILIFLFVSPIYLWAQQNDKSKILSIIKNCKQKYETLKTYEIKSEYQSYATYTSTKMNEQYKGHLIKKNDLSYIRIGAIERVALRGYTIAIDNETKLMTCKRDEVKKESFEILDIEQYTAHFDKFLLEEDSTYWIFTLSTSSPIVFCPYIKIKIKISKKDYLLKEQTLYMANSAPYYDSKGEKKYDFPRIHIKFLETKATVAAVIDELKFETYFKIVNKKMIPNGLYKQYKLTNN